MPKPPKSTELQIKWDKILTNMGLGMSVGIGKQLNYGWDYSFNDKLNAAPCDYEKKTKRFSKPRGGYKLSAETRARMSAARKGVPTKIPNEATRRKMSESAKARTDRGMVNMCGHPERKHESKGMCRSCYMRKRRAGGNTK